MSKAPRKSIIRSFASFGAEQNAETGKGTSSTKADPSFSVSTPASPHASGLAQRVGASVIGATQRSIAELRDERDRLYALVEAGGARQIEPGLIDPSPFHDRMPDDDDADFIQFRARFAEEGQKVPAEVREHPEQPGRFQLVYGHRRWRAAIDLGVQLHVILVKKTDIEVAVSQGIENAERQDLSWIERATFAATLEKAGLKARDIRGALGIDDAELARFRAVLRILPGDMIRVIGRAPKAGRPRWVELAKLAAEHPVRLAELHKTLAAAKVSTSDGRLQASLSLLRGAKEARSKGIELRDEAGRLLASAQIKRGSLQLTADKAVEGDLEDFLREDLRDFARRFMDWQSRRDSQ